MASNGEGKKRRSFLPAPKKSTGLSPTSPQSPFSSAISESQLKAEPLPKSLLRAEPLPKPQLRAEPSSQSVNSDHYNTSSKTVSLDVSNKDKPKTTASQSSYNLSTKNDKLNDDLNYGVGLRVGAKVLIGGIKPGILRYLGTTHLAPGIFCGIELRDPEGIHDGEVNGHRYFFCTHNHGIFAPKEKVCLDTSSSLSRLASDADVCYSSTESLNERRLKAFKCYEEGELEAIDCTKLSPILSPPDPRLTRNDAHVKRTKCHKQADHKDKQNDKCEAPSTSVAELRKSFEPQVSDEVKKTIPHSGLPKAAKTVPVPTPSTSSKLPTFSRTYNKFGDGYVFNQRSSCTTNSCDLFAPPLEVASQIFIPGFDSEKEAEKSSPRHRSNSTRSIEDLEEDGLVRDTLSTGVKKQLRQDSRQYLNFTFDQDELIQSLDTEEGDCDNDYINIKGLNGEYADRTNSIFCDAPVVRNILDESSDGIYRDLTSSATRSIEACTRENFMKIETGTVVLKAEVQYFATVHSEGPPAIKSDSFTIASPEIVRSLDMNATHYEPEEEAAGLSVTRSISESELPADLLPFIDNQECSKTANDANKSFDEDAHSADKRATIKSDDGGENLNRTQTLHVHQTENEVKSNDEIGINANQSQSYTICSNDLESKRDSSKRERDSTVVASHSYIISKTDSAASSPCRKYRKISTGSSANEGGDSSSSGTEPKTDSSGDNKGDNLDDSSTGASPEVSQALEWDYGQEFDGKIPLSHQDNAMTASTSTGTSESLSDVLRDISEQSDGLFEGDAPSSLLEDSDQFENPDNEFENIDSIEDFPIFGKDCITIMTDSGISDKDFDFCPNKSSSSTVCGNSSDECSREDDASSHTTSRAISSDSSQETLAAEFVADTPGSVEDKDFLSDDMCTTICTDDSKNASRRNSFDDGNSNSPASVVSIEDAKVLQDRTLVGDDLSEDNDRNFSSREDVSSSTDTSVVIKADAAVSPSKSSGEKQETFHTEFDFEMYHDSEGRASNKRDRPISLLSTTSADTGYVPDSDSELGTLTTNSPTTIDWTDRLGVTHPTSHAPYDSHATNDIDGCDIRIDDIQSGSSSPTICTHHNVARTSDYDDYSSDPTANAEDDRIEADRVYGQWDNNISIPSNVVQDEPTSMDIPSEDSDQKYVDSNHDLTGGVSKETPYSIATDEGFASREKNDSKKVLERNNKKKTITLTKKRSENVVHQMPNTNVTSRLANYIKAPNPVKTKEEKDKNIKNVIKNLKNVQQKRRSVAEVNNSKNKEDYSRAPSIDRTNNKRDSSSDRVFVEKIEKSKPAIRRTPPKSKWGNIMSQIEAGKDTTKPKLKSEVKSSLAAYLSAPSPAHPLFNNNEDNSIIVNMVTDQPNIVSKREVKSKLKNLPPLSQKIDLSKVKSKLNVPTAASAVKAVPKREHSPSSSKVKNAGRPFSTSVGVDPGKPHTKGTDGAAKRLSQGNCVLLQHPATKNSISSAKTSQTDISVFDSNASIAGSQAEEGVTSKRGSFDLKHGQRRSSFNSYKSENSEKPKVKKEQTKKLNGTLPIINNTRKPRANGVPKISTNKARTTTSSGSTATSVAQAEIMRLESLCEARTKELIHTKMDLRNACQAFDAMAALVNYCCVDLNAFECIPLANKLETVQKELTECLSRIAELNAQKEALEKNIAEIIQEKEEVARKAQEACETLEKEREEHSRVTHEMDDTYNAALTAQRDELTSQHDESLKKMNHFYDKQIDLLRLAHERQVTDIKNDNKMEFNTAKISHLEEIQELRNKHDSQMEELHKQHRNKLEDITHRFESIKLTLSEKVESLRGECDDLARRARSSEDALQRDADAKVQIALAPFLTLPKEIESLKMVLEMRNEEIQKLRTKNMDVEKQLEEIPISREKIISLQQKVENLEAIINIKTDHEKQLHEKCQILMRKYDRESRANKRLSMDYEQVVWRMSQSSDFGSCDSLTKRHLSRSPPHSKEGSPDGRYRAVSPNSNQNDVVLRVKKRSSHSISEGDRQLRARSATFVVDKSESSSSHSPSMSPQLKQKRWRKKSQVEEVVAKENGNLHRMCHSAGDEVMSDICGQQTLIEDNTDMNSKDINVMSANDMASSYARSISGVSDSGMYDSMTKSDALGSSIVSTDSEWGTSVNLSLNCDSTLVDDAESGPAAGEYYSLNDVTVIETKMSSSSNDSNNVILSNINNVSSSSPRSSTESRNEDEQNSNYQVYVTLPHRQDITEDSVFDEKTQLEY